MTIVKRRCKFFNVCHFADETSRTCTKNGGGNYCGAYRALSFNTEKAKDTGKERRR